MRRARSLEVWLDAILFGIRLATAAGVVFMVVWRVSLPPNRSNAQTGFDDGWYLAAQDCYAAACSVGALYLLLAGLLTAGGLLQLWKSSPRSAAWSLAFGAFALIAGLVLLCAPAPTEFYEIFRPRAGLSLQATGAARSDLNVTADSLLPGFVAASFPRPCLHPR